MGVSSNTLHLRSADAEGVLRAYGTMLRRRGYRLRAASGIPHYLETHDEPVFRRVLVSTPREGWITVIDQQFDEQDLPTIDRATAEMSKAMTCPALALVVHEGEALYLFHWDNGQRRDRWCSWPGWYADGPVSESVKKRWTAHPERLLPLCREGTTAEHVAFVMRDYSAEERFVFPENVLADLQEILGLHGGPRTYAALHAQPSGLYLTVPDGRGTVRIDSDPHPDPYWEDFTRLHFVRL
jgi:hypothetical protein